MPDNFKEYLDALAEEEYSNLISERIKRLNADQQKIVLIREIKRKHHLEIIKTIKSMSLDEDMNQMYFNQMRDEESDNCEHGRYLWTTCQACGEIDHLMFPELFDENGFLIEEE